MYRQPEINFSPDEVLKYSRKSQSDDPLMTVEEVLAKHEEILNDWSIKNLGGIIPAQNSFREVVSGETIQKRPEIQKLLKLIESPKYKAVLVVEPQRLSRGDLEDIGRIMKLFKHTNTIILTTTRPYDLHDEYDWDIFERELKRGNEYLEYYKKIQARGKMLSISQGNFIGSKPPYGFNRAFVMDGKRKCPTLVENEEQANIVRLIFDLYVNKGYGPQKIANHLESMGVRPTYGKYWTPVVIKTMLGNEHYIGKVRWNWRKNITVVEDGDFHTVRPKAKVGEYLIFDGKHNGIVPEDLFYAARERLGKTPKVQTNKIMQNPFASLIYCRNCGRAVILQTPNKRTPARLLCGNYRHCTCGSSDFDFVFNHICYTLKQCIENFEIKLSSEAKQSINLYADLLKNLNKRMSDLEARELSQWEAQADPDPSKRMPHEIFQKLNEKLLREKQELKEAIRKTNESMPSPVDYQEKIYMFSDCLNALRDPTIPALKKNNLLKLCIEKITYFREKPQRIPGVFGEWTDPPVQIDVILKI